MNRSLLLALSCLPLGLALACNDCTGPLPDAGPPPSGDGVIRIDGEEQPYSVSFADSELLIVVKLKEQFGCGVFHSHVVEASSFQLDFTLDESAPDTSEIVATVPAAALTADDPELRARFPETQSSTLSEDDRRRVRVSVFEELKAETHPTLTFRATDLTVLEGQGGANVEVTLGGATSTVAMSYEAAFDEDGVLVVDASGSLDGAPHGIPSGFGSDCVQPVMDLHMKLTLVPGSSEGPPPVDGGPVAFEPTFYPYDGGCDDVVGFAEVREVIGPRCAGCHLDPPRLGATTPLVEWEDFRVNAARSPDGPLYETMAELIQLPEDASLHMPPIDLSQLTSAERDLLLEWATRGAPPEKCTPDPVRTFTHVEAAACGPVAYEDVAPIFEDNCNFCHGEDAVSVPRLDSYAAGLADSVHPYYLPLNLWESSLARIEDDSMPPGGGFGQFLPDELALLQAWIAGGYPEVRCDAGDGGVSDAGSTSDGGVADGG